MRLLPVLFLLILLPQLATAQSNELDKKLERAKQIASKEGIKDADEYLVKLLRKDPDYGAGWDLLAKIRYQQYENSKSLDGMLGNLNVTMTPENVKDEKGKKIKLEDSVVAQVKDMLANYKPSDAAYNKLIYTLRKATLLAPREAGQSSYMLRNLTVDVEVDSNVNRKALRYYTEAEEQFAKNNFASAAKLYQRALDEQPDFYKARLYLGDSYYFTENYAEAARVFSDAVKKFPMLLEPRKYLTDAYAKMRLYDKAVAAAIGSLTVYPDISMSTKLGDAAYLNDQRLTLAGTVRGAFPAGGVVATRGHSYRADEDSVKPTGPWVLYAKASQQLAPFYTDEGIIKPGNAGMPRHLDVACWEAMLKESNDSVLDEARAAQKAGNLDCYALVTCFHHDLYPQYRDFSARNIERIVRFYTEAIRAL